MCTWCPNIIYIFFSICAFFKCNLFVQLWTTFFQIWPIFPSAIFFSESLVFLRVTFFLKWPVLCCFQTWPFYQVWHIFPTRREYFFFFMCDSYFCKCLTHHSKSDPVFKVSQIFPSVTPFCKCDLLLSISDPILQVNSCETFFLVWPLF